MTERPPLSNEEILRYSRHLILPQVAGPGQHRLKQSRVLVVGAGGLGSPAALYLAAAGVGALGVVDCDVVEPTNLHRQVLHGTDAVGRRKVASAADRLRDLNPHVEVEAFDTRLTSENALEVVRSYDVVVDGSDNFPTRYLVNDACVLTGTPDVYGAIFQFDGQVAVFAAQGGPCYRCLFREPPPPDLVPSCDVAGVLGVVPGVVGSLQALEAIKLVLGIGTPLVGRLLLFDGLDLGFRELEVRRDAECPVCGDHPTVTELIDYEAFCGVGRDALPAVPEITVEELAHAREAHDGVMVVDVREPLEWKICHLEGSTLIPLGDLAQRSDELRRDADIVMVCHYGDRSARAVAVLREAGFERVRNLKGGVDEWARQVEPGMARY
jgi:adenylyltransferase/sulfurtransferase